MTVAYIQVDGRHTRACQALSKIGISLTQTRDDLGSNQDAVEVAPKSQSEGSRTSNEAGSRYSQQVRQQEAYEGFSQPPILNRYVTSKQHFP